MTRKTHDEPSIALDDSENISTNPSNNRPFSDVLNATMSRRSVLKGSLAAAGATYISSSTASAHYGNHHWGKNYNQALVDFAPLTTEEVNAAQGIDVTISSDYQFQPLIPWGTPIKSNIGVPEFTGDPENRPTSTEAEKQIGIGHDGMWFFPVNQKRALAFDMKIYRRLKQKPKFAKFLKRLIGKIPLSSRVGFLCINHEFGTNSHVLGKSAPDSLEDVRISQAVHGASVVGIFQNKSDGLWRVFNSSRNRRITVNSPVKFSGPAADSELLVNPASNPTLGTVNNCGAGPTPWGTYVTCEENFNGYFGANGEFIPNEAQARYGLNSFGFGYSWFVFDDRFDQTNPMYINESNRFGWCVEINPFDKKDVPTKRTALGRFKHEAVAFVPEKFDERAICYMGDDQRGDYCYKYVSDRAWREHLLDKESPLDHGTLYVARFDEGADGNDGLGTGEWIELSMANPTLAANFNDQGEILVNSRLAADLVGATPMDRPEWATVGTKGEVFWAFTNNDRKDDGAGAVSEANPIFENTDGHIIKTEDTSDTAFTWNIFLLARNTRRPDDVPAPDANDLPYAAYTAPADGGANVFTDPDAVYADEDGRLFIGTDGGQRDGLQDQLVVIDAKTGEYRRLLSGVTDDEITGIAPTPNQRVMFTNTQHPGNGNPASTNFPAPFDGVTIPRDCTLVITKKDGGVIGS
ncbi:MAG: PhoX family phosphatase [Pseudomonadota bacterium]